MAGFNRSAVIARPVEEVFDFATDLRNASLLMPNVISAEIVTDGGMKQGARFRETRRMGRKEVTAVIEVVEHQRPRVHTARSTMLGLRATYRFRFAPEGAGTRVDMEAVVRGNLLWKLFLRTISRTMEKEDGEFLTRLQDALERSKPG